MVALALTFRQLLVDIVLLQPDQQEPPDFPGSEFEMLYQ
jgi:hypothetical protein